MSTKGLTREEWLSKFTREKGWEIKDETEYCTTLVNVRSINTIHIRTQDGKGFEFETYRTAEGRALTGRVNSKVTEEKRTPKNPPGTPRIGRSDVFDPETGKWHQIAKVDQLKEVVSIGVDPRDPKNVIAAKVSYTTGGSAVSLSVLNPRNGKESGMPPPAPIDGYLEVGDGTGWALLHDPRVASKKVSDCEKRKSRARVLQEKNGEEVLSRQRKYRKRAGLD